MMRDFARRRHRGDATTKLEHDECSGDDDDKEPHSKKAQERHMQKERNIKKKNVVEKLAPEH